MLDRFSKSIMIASKALSAARTFAMRLIVVCTVRFFGWVKVGLAVPLFPALRISLCGGFP